VGFDVIVAVGEDVGDGFGDEDGFGVGVGVGVGEKIAVIVPGPFIVAVVEAELASLNLIEPVSDDQSEKV